MEKKQKKKTFNFQNIVRHLIMLRVLELMMETRSFVKIGLAKFADKISNNLLLQP